MIEFPVDWDLSLNWKVLIGYTKLNYVVICATNNNTSQNFKKRPCICTILKNEIIYGSIKTIVEVCVIKVRKCLFQGIVCLPTNEPLENDTVGQ